MALHGSSVLPIDASERKAAPVFSGMLMYFPKACVAIARLSLAGNIQHYGPGKPLHWNREVSADHQDCMVRHAMQSGTYDTDGILHDVKAAWRALAQAEVTIDRLERDAALREMSELAQELRIYDPTHTPEVEDEDDLGLKAGEAFAQLEIGN
jgi:hypothetical protein